MASAVTQGCRLIVYSRGLRSLSASLRSYSQASSNSKSTRNFMDDDEEGHTETVWPDASLGIFAPNDMRMSLPGNVGFSSDLKKKKNPLNTKIIEFCESPVKNDILTCVLPNERHQSVFFQVVNMEEMALTKELENELVSRINAQPQMGQTLECVAQICPSLMKKDFKDLFPDRNLLDEQLTVITLSQKTVNDMSIWSDDADQEREELSEFFMIAAEYVCNILAREGFWADFIDPATGKPHLGSHTNAVLSETDERYRHFGFSIEDLGCCKVISHHIWGTRTFVGSLFSNVPLDNPVLRNILTKYTNVRYDSKDQS